MRIAPLHLIAALALQSALVVAGCEHYLSPEGRYYALNAGVTEAAKQASAYIDACKAKHDTDQCKAIVPKLGEAANIAKTTLGDADKVFVGKEAGKYDLTLALAENALTYLNNTLSEGSK